MAIDTAAKRHSVILFGRGGPPRPDATIAEADRATLLGLYGGIDVAAPPVVLATATTPAQLRALIEADDLAIDWTMALHDKDEAYVADITPDVRAATITRNLYRTLHGTARFTLSRQLLWGSQRLAPSVTLTSPSRNLTATWAMGRWLTSIPTREVGAVPESYEVEAYDKLMLCDKLLGRSYAVASGTSYVTAVETILTTELGEAASSVAIDQASVASTTSTTLNWILDDRTTWLRVINDLLQAIDYEGLWVDRDGRWRSRPYTLPADRGTTFHFDADDKEATIVGETRTVVPARRGEDLLGDPVDTPNVFTFIDGDIGKDPPTVGSGIFTETNQSDGPTSIDKRGFIPTVQQLPTFFAQPQLQAWADRYIGGTAYRLSTHLELDTGPCPPLWHMDVVDLIDSALGSHRRWAVEEWEIELPSGDMRHRWRDVQAAG